MPCRDRARDRARKARPSDNSESDPDTLGTTKKTVIKGKLTDLAALTQRALPPSMSQYFRPF